MMSRAWKVPLSLYIHALKGVELARVRVVSSTVLGVKMIQHRDITGMSYFGHGGDLSHYSLPPRQGLLGGAAMVASTV